MEIVVSSWAPSISQTNLYWLVFKALHILQEPLAHYKLDY